MFAFGSFIFALLQITFKGIEGIYKLLGHLAAELAVVLANLLRLLEPKGLVYLPLVNNIKADKAEAWGT